GYVVVPNLAPYQLDTVRINPEDMPLGVQLDATSARVAPYAGAVVLLNFKTHYGRAVIASLVQTNGKPVPFGAEVTNAQGKTIGTVGQNGRALLRMQQQAGRLQASWGAGSNPTSCQFGYRLPKPGEGASSKPYLYISETRAPARVAPGSP